MSQTEIEQLRDRITQLEAMIAEMTARRPDAPVAPDPSDASDPSHPPQGSATEAGTDTPGERPSSRRGLIKAAVASAGAAVVATAAMTDTAQAADLALGAWNQDPTPTEIDYTGMAAAAGFLFQVGTTFTPAGAPFASRPAALAGSSALAHHPTAVLGYSEVNPGTGVWGVAGGTSGVGVRADGPAGLVATSTSSNGHGVEGISNAGYGVRGSSSDNVGVVGNSTYHIGVFGAGVTGARGEGVLTGVHGEGLGGGAGVTGVAAGTGVGVVGIGSTGIGVSGATSGTAAGVHGSAPSGSGVVGEGGQGVTGTSTTGYGVVGDGVAGVVGIGSQFAFVASVADSSALYLRSARRTGGGNRIAPPSRGDAHVVGELDVDANGDLWLCVADGTPGSWRKISGPSTAGAFHALAPGRVYDSRVAAPGPVAMLAGGDERTVSVRDRRSTVDGAVTLADFVPTGATAIAANVTVVDTVGAGFLTANPGGVHDVNAATINWSETGQILNNGVILTLDAGRELNVIAGGGTGAATHLVIDVTGYYR